jgi:hypothetical protein
MVRTMNCRRQHQIFYYRYVLETIHSEKNYRIELYRLCTDFLTKEIEHKLSNAWRWVNASRNLGSFGFCHHSKQRVLNKAYEMRSKMSFNMKRYLKKIMKDEYHGS